ncbi:hypothetical protein GCM10027160_09180 [Streptomyces calidiresistens]|uniref:Tripartite tricarboxylate transporter TctB family protein n=1 Tax=Streptomyces calidiresistens TaxID=1485586 RepID=A0A7W3XUR2_9ACTN|nr:tripartite tricarboxylate transporter TctB family protein [Streptomyces calidiresistens]MBB0227947.1 tripartite tricarboxylate transporter TctB family protein [Streptomyces calidiresistens]
MGSFRFSQRTVAVAVGVLAIAYTVEAFRIPEFTAVQVPVQSGTLPRGLGLMLLGLAVVLFFRRDGGAGPSPSPAPASVTASAPGEGDGSGAATTPEAPPAPGGRVPAPGRFRDVRLEVAALLGSICLYVALFEPLGFLLSTALYIAGMAWYLGLGRPWAGALTGAGVSLALHLGMSRGLDIALPTGPLPF